jgi:hypothetical protein
VDLSLVASVNKPTPAYNSEVEFTWTVANATNLPTSLVQVGLEWPVGVTWVGDDSGGAYNRTTGEWNVGGMPANGVKTLKVRAKVGAASSYTASGEIIYAFNEDPDSTPFNRHINANEDDTASVIVRPVANNAPSLAATASVSVLENTTAVSTVKGSDVDGDTLSYSISGGADGSKFVINANTGVLRFISAPDYEKPADADKNNSYLVQVTVSDGKLTAKQSINVTVTDDTTENALPVILPGSNAATHTQSYVENTSNLLVLDYDATDADGDIEGNGLTWLITGGEDKWAFTMHPAKGWLEFTGVPDFERPLDVDKKNTYEVQVTVCDSKGGCTTQKLTVKITDVPEDTDADGILDQYEIESGTVDPFSNGKDTDSDGIPDYRDPDDDGDGILTQHEMADSNGDGNPADARNTDSDDKPDYLDADDDGDGKLTSTERADPNGDGNPSDAIDSDDDGISNYLDNNDEPSVHLSMRAYLQGAYNAQTALMNNQLFTKGYVPKPQPFNKLVTSFGYTVFEGIPPFNYHGDERISDSVAAMTAENAPVDWVLLELREVANPARRVAGKAALLQRDGDVINAATGSTNIVFRGVAPGSYYVVLRHRNHIGLMTAMPLSLGETAVPLDFTKPTYPVYGENQRYLVDDKAFLWAGDSNNSNSVVGSGPGSDTNIMLGAILIAPENTLVTTHFRMAGYYATDLNLDGLTVFSGPSNDLNILLGNIMVHPVNTDANANFVIYGAVPR